MPLVKIIIRPPPNLAVGEELQPGSLARGHLPRLLVAGAHHVDVVRRRGARPSCSVEVS